MACMLCCGCQCKAARRAGCRVGTWFKGPGLQGTQHHSTPGDPVHVLTTQFVQRIHIHCSLSVDHNCASSTMPSAAAAAAAAAVGAGVRAGVGAGAAGASLTSFTRMRLGWAGSTLGTCASASSRNVSAQDAQLGCQQGWKGSQARRQAQRGGRREHAPPQ
jgi:hypothetical protein